MSKSADRLTAEIAGIVIDALLVASSRPFGTEWNDREANGKIRLEPELRALFGARRHEFDAFLGGDSLRPYLAVHFGETLLLASKRTHDLSVPLLLKQISGGIFGLPQAIHRRREAEEYTVQHLSANEELQQRLVVPNVFLASLTNPSRYQTRRYPLNIGRLAQWLRFQHAARARAEDLAQGFDGDVQALAARIVQANPDILGISMNFGEMRTFESLIGALRRTRCRPVICVGNVLAAWASDHVAEVCSGYPVFVSYSYGEVPLESLCRRLAMGSVDLHSRHVVHLDRGIEPLTQSPDAIVLPDERLLAETLGRGGQASIETSFGCQYSHCTFCPRSHRGSGWERPSFSDATAVAERIAAHVVSTKCNGRGVLSIVDEDAFGQEGIESGTREPSVVGMIERAGKHGIGFEIYTRLEQVFDRRKGRDECMARLQQLRRMAPSMVRVFVGVESGCDAQLRRYAKGQKVQDVSEALRAGSMLGLPLEFGFITFDPLLSPRELIENIEFLARTDVLPPPHPELSVREICDLLLGDEIKAFRGDPVFSRVAYMATELELFANSPYLLKLKRSHAELVGPYDEGFARHSYQFLHPEVGVIAAWCRVWTEGTFKPIYRMRLASRAGHDGSGTMDKLIRKYRETTFGLLISLAGRLLPAFRPRALEIAETIDRDLPLSFSAESPTIRELEVAWQWFKSIAPATPIHDPVSFDIELLGARRAT